MKRLTIRQPVRRSGFTLVELIVVMGIIAVLAGLVTVAVASFVANSRVNATQTLVNKVNKLISDRQGAIDRYFIECERRGGGQRPPEYLTQQQRISWRNNPANREIYELLGKKDFLRRNLPTRFADADLDLDGNPDIQPGAGHQPETENAEVLYYFLTNAAQYGGEPVGTGEFGSNEVKDTDGDGLLELVDAWGNPLRFYLWPTRLFRPQDPGNEGTAIAADANGFLVVDINLAAAQFLMGNIPLSSVLATDPEDPLQVNTAAPDVFEQNYHTAGTWHAPLVLSAGEDGILGLLEPTDRSQYGHLAQPKLRNGASGLEPDPALLDDVSSLLLRTGGN